MGVRCAVAALLCAALLLAVSPTRAAEGTQAATGLHHAGLIVRHGDGHTTYAYVAFPEEEIGGVDLLERSAIEHVAIPFGGLGLGVCLIDGEGCGAADCRRLCQTGGSDSPYWRYFGLGADGQWAPFELGVSSARVHDGDVQLWSWSPDEPGLAPVGIDQVAILAGVGAAGAVGTDHMVWVATIYPAGTRPASDDDRQAWWAYGAVGVVVAGMLGAGVVVARRRGEMVRP